MISRYAYVYLWGRTIRAVWKTSQISVGVLVARETLKGKEGLPELIVEGGPPVLLQCGGNDEGGEHVRRGECSHGPTGTCCRPSKLGTDATSVGIAID